MHKHQPVVCSSYIAIVLISQQVRQCKLWRQLAETVEKYVRKGDKLYIEGKLHTRSYDDRSGQKRYVVEIWAEAMEMLSPRRQDNVDNPIVEP